MNTYFRLLQCNKWKILLKKKMFNTYFHFLIQWRHCNRLLTDWQIKKMDLPKIIFSPIFFPVSVGVGEPFDHRDLKIESDSDSTKWGSVTHQIAVPVPSLRCCVLNHYNLFNQIQNVLAFNWDTSCHLALCLQLLPFH